MCYSAMIEADYQTYLRATDATLSLGDFVKRYWERQQGLPIKMPLAVDRWFTASRREDEIAGHIAAFRAAAISKHEQELFKQSRRLADAERILRTKTTRKALEDQRIATDKIAWIKGKLADLQRSNAHPRDARFFPGWQAPVVIAQEGHRVVVPMRYQCRPTGRPAFYDTRYPGTYNARRDNLEGFWKGQFGHTHGVVVVSRFYENVERVDAEGNPHNAVLEFTPADGEAMLVACLWSRWVDPAGKEDDLLSFAAITDEPPAEVAAAGHDRCLIPIKPAHLEAWLHPDPMDLAASYAILDDRARPYYAHRLATAA